MAASAAARRAISPEARTAIAGGARAEKARRRFWEFFRQGWHVVEGVPLEENAYIIALCDHLQALGEGWLVANKKANERQRERVIAHWARHGLTFKEGHLLVQNMIVNMPPGTLKSRILMVFFPAWMWLHAPSFAWACTSSNDENVRRDSDDHQKLIRSDWYRHTFSVTWEIRARHNAVGKWSTTAGGSRISRTILAGFVGIHADGILVDDPDDPMRVFNEPDRRRVHQKFSKAIENRVNHEMRSIRVVAQQRVHAEDLTGYVRAQSAWTVKARAGWMTFAIPLEAGKLPRDLPVETAFGWRDPRKVAANDNEPPEIMLPERYPPELIADKRLKLGSHGFESQYNQNPESLDGGWFKRINFRFFELAPDPRQPKPDRIEPRPPPEGCSKEKPYVVERDERSGKLKIDFLAITVDASFGSLNEKTASGVGLLVVGGVGMRRLVFDDATDLMSFSVTVETIKKLIRTYPARKVIIEIKANGPATIERLHELMLEAKLVGPDGNPVSVKIEAYDPGKDSKRARAAQMMPDVEAGLVFLLAGAHWLERFLKEVCVFPNAPRDDRVDALAQALAYYRDNNSLARRYEALSR